MRITAFLLLLLLSCTAAAQQALSYRVRPDTARRTISVELTVPGAPKVFNLATYAHPEYDDRYWRYVRDLRVAGGSVRRLDSALWELTHEAGGDALVSYRVELPQAEGFRPAWRPHLGSGIALLGGPHTFLYPTSMPAVAAQVQLELPQDWKVFTALAPAAPGLWRAPDIAALMDAPILAGRIASRSHFSKEATHVVAYASPAADGLLDKLNSELMALTAQAGRLFGGYPFKSYWFLLQDSAYGGLEHAASATLGVSSERLRGPERAEELADIAHEYLHAWNLVALRPRGYGGLTWKNPGPARELWFSEGFTLYYADLLLRRARLPVPDSTRADHLRTVLESYYRNSGNYLLPPARVSLDANATPGSLGDYNASPHQQGEVIATLLDWKIRTATGGAKTLDDFMRRFYQRFRGKGFTETDIKQEAESICSCRLDTFFNSYINNGRELPVAATLAEMGWRFTRQTVTDSSGGAPRPDVDMYAWQDAQGILRLGLNRPNSCWTAAGLHTGDELLAFGGSTVTTQREFFSRMRAIKVGEIVGVAIRKDGRPQLVRATVTPATREAVHLTPARTSPAMERLRAAWLRGQ
ncbi:hypothetical protein EPD60_05860 [Flaviaesturariibacter flavus]|uniref:M61 family peptidase n=1 Tax=Flaviaesturariibacter flavus TaxID=2502780 RepID=A0A4R1BK50_9BACT|nr:hypothetical protein [Flaviaesturariibacter flavus]TCJ17713.1 hypothetical protein EPD60_05860 [Flaviaesturariibacter flavus]